MSENETEGPILDQLAVDWSKVKLALAKFSDPPSTGKLGCHGSAVPGDSATGGIRVAALTLMSTLFPNRFLVHLVDLMAGAGMGFGLAARMDASAAPVVARVLTKIKEAEAMRSEELLNSFFTVRVELLIVLPPILYQRFWLTVWLTGNYVHIGTNCHCRSSMLGQ